MTNLFVESLKRSLSTSAQQHSTPLAHSAITTDDTQQRLTLRVFHNQFIRHHLKSDTMF